MEIAHRGLIHQPNTLPGVLDAYKVADVVEVDVRFNTRRDVVLCHDRERRNDASNPTLERLLKKLGPHRKLMLDIKAFGFEEAKKLARAVCDIVVRYPLDVVYLGSFNEYCVDELLNFRDERAQSRWKIGVISAGIPLGMFEHLSGLDFVSLDYNSVCEDVAERVRERGMQLFVWVVNDVSMRQLMRQYGVDGLVVDKRLVV